MLIIISFTHFVIAFIQFLKFSFSIFLFWHELTTSINLMLLKILLVVINLLTCANRTFVNSVFDVFNGSIPDFQKLT